MFSIAQMPELAALPVQDKEGMWSLSIECFNDNVGDDDQGKDVVDQNTLSELQISEHMKPCPYSRPSSVKFAWGAPSLNLSEKLAEPKTPNTFWKIRGFQQPGGLVSPASSSAKSFRCVLTPRTPTVDRRLLKCLKKEVAVIFFDFDGTLTASPGDRAHRFQKQGELCERAPMLSPWLRSLQRAGICLGIASKSTEQTIRSALEGAKMSDIFGGPLISRAVGFEGKAGFIEEAVTIGSLKHLGLQGLHQVALIDDDTFELECAQEKGIQTYPAPRDGGLQDADFVEILYCLNLSNHDMTGQHDAM